MKGIHFDVLAFTPKVQPFPEYKLESLSPRATLRFVYA